MFARRSPGRRGSHRDVRTLIDGAVALGLAVAGVTAVSGIPEERHPWAELFAGAMLLAIALRTVEPALMVGAFCLGLVGYALLPYPGTPLPLFVAVLVVSFSAGQLLGGRRAVAAVVALMAATLLLQLRTRATASADELSWADVYLTPLVVIGGPAGAGALLRRAQRQTAELKRLAAELAAERRAHAEAAAAAERARIARELHDVISHSVSVMVVQAGAAEQALRSDDPALEQVHAIRATGKEALAELRRQLGVLRSDHLGPTPLPGLDDLEQLARTSGAELVVDGAPAVDLPPGAALTAYRVVQESLTNARRHAVGGEVSVRVRYGPDGVELVTEDTGGTSTTRGGGFGLTGLRERVELYGGRVSAGPRVDGPGWRVCAWIPTREAGT